MPYLGESTLGESEVFNRTINSGIDGSSKATDQAIAMIKAGKFLTKEDYLKAYTLAERTNDSVIKDALRYLSTGKIKLVYDPDRKVMMSKALPFITFQNGGKYTTYIFMDPYVKAAGDGTYTFKDTVFKDLLVAGMISNLLKTNYSAIKNNTTLKEMLMKLYSQFFVRVINRLATVMSNKQLVDKIKYCTNRFFLENVFTGSAAKINSGSEMASKDTKALSGNELEELQMNYDAADIHSLSKLLQFMSTLSPRLRGLQMREFMQKWMNTYYITQMLSVDTLEYFFFMLMALYYNDSQLVNVRAVDILRESKALGPLHASIARLSHSQLSNMSESVKDLILESRIDRMMFPGDKASDLDLDAMDLRLEYAETEDPIVDEAVEESVPSGYDPLAPVSLYHFEENYRSYMMKRMGD